MAKELYENCPCGSGKKIKFCCPRELQSDFLKAIDLLQSGQRAAAIERADRGLAKAPGQSCFLMVKIFSLLQLHEREAAVQAWQQLNQSTPNNPVTKVFQVLLGIDIDTPHDLVHRMQDAMEEVRQFPIPWLVISGLEMTISSLLHFGSPFAFIQYGHHYDKLMLDHPQQDILGAVRRACLEAQFPVLYKQPWIDRLAGVFPEALKKGDVRQDLAMFRWRRLRDRFKQWRAQGQCEPGATAFQALMHALLLESQEAATLFRELSTRPNVPLEVAAEAKLVAHLFDPAGDPGAIKQSSITYTIADMDRLMERLLSDRRSKDVKLDVSNLAQDDEPPPRAAFRLLDRPLPADIAATPVPELPRVLGTALVYGRQTDREARLEIDLKLEPGENPQQQLEEIFGDTVNVPPTSEELGDLSPLFALGPVLEVPENLGYQEAVNVNQQYLEYSISEYWPNRPNPLLSGKTPTEAANDPSLKVGLAAALIHIESTNPSDMWLGDFGQLWKRLGLDYELAAWDPRKPQIVWLPRLNPEKLDDAVLWSAAVFSAAMCVRQACVRLGQAVLSRPTLRERDELGELLRVLSETPLAAKDRLAFVEAAIEWCENKNLTSGPFRVRKFVCHVMMGDHDKSTETLNELTSNYRNEPETMELLFETLRSMGLIRPDGKLTGDELDAEGTAEPAAAGSVLWTSDQPKAGAEAEKPSKLWLPGQ